MFDLCHQQIDRIFGRLFDQDQKTRVERQRKRSVHRDPMTGWTDCSGLRRLCPVGVTNTQTDDFRRPIRKCLVEINMGRRAFTGGAAGTDPKQRDIMDDTNLAAHLANDMIEVRIELKFLAAKLRNSHVIASKSPRVSLVTIIGIKDHAGELDRLDQRCVGSIVSVVIDDHFILFPAFLLRNTPNPKGVDFTIEKPLTGETPRIDRAKVLDDTACATVTNDRECQIVQAASGATGRGDHVKHFSKAPRSGKHPVTLPVRFVVGPCFEIGQSDTVFRHRIAQIRSHQSAQINPCGMSDRLVRGPRRSIPDRRKLLHHGIQVVDLTVQLLRRLDPDGNFRDLRVRRQRAGIEGSDGRQERSIIVRHPVVIGVEPGQSDIPFTGTREADRSRMANIDHLKILKVICRRVAFELHFNPRVRRTGWAIFDLHLDRQRNRSPFIVTNTKTVERHVDCRLRCPDGRSPSHRCRRRDFNGIGVFGHVVRIQRHHIIVTQPADDFTIRCKIRHRSERQCGIYIPELKLDTFKFGDVGGPDFQFGQSYRPISEGHPLANVDVFTDCFTMTGCRLHRRHDMPAENSWKRVERTGTVRCTRQTIVPRGIT